MGNSDQVESIVAFHHADAAWKTEVKSEMDVTRDFGFYGDANLGDFLSRPVRIGEYDWTVTSGNFSVNLNPWELFLTNARVRDRVEGYRLLQGTLHLRLAINGGPFFYGRAIASYRPRHLDDSHSFLANEGYLMQLSMLPHVYLDPTTSEGGEIVCPFFNPDNWIDLIGDTFLQMGQLRIKSINDLNHANASTGTVGISVYAWMEDVRLAAPTTLGYAQYDAHAGDEYGTGIISKPASSVAKVLGLLSEIPIIKPFARPSEIVASTIGRVAHVFGFSRPAIISDIERAKIKNTGNMANTDAHEALVKLTLDSKQELSVDPRTVGLSDVDEMSFDYIKCKEAYLSSFSWGENDSSGAELARLSVGPDQHNTGQLGGIDTYVLAPMYTCALPFRYWRGTIIFRFQIVASQLHRGRLRFSYDPYFFSGLGDPDENAVYSRIIDLATNRDFEMAISWNHARSWLRVDDRLTLGSSGSFGHPVGTNGIDFAKHNGMIRVSVANELTSPDPALANDIFINCFASAGEDFEVAEPHDDILHQLQFEAQGGGYEVVYEPQGDGEEVVEEVDGIPESPVGIAPIGTPEGPANPNSHIFFGERFASIRALLKRYCYHQTIQPEGGYSSYYWIESNFPVEPGQSVSPRHITGASATPSSTPYNYTGMTYLNYFTPHFIGWRGSLRSKYVPNSTGADGKIAVRRTGPVDQASCGTTAIAVNSSFARQSNAQYLELYRTASAGIDVVTPSTDGSLEVEFPFYSNKRFAPARKMLDGSGVTDANYEGNDFGHVGFAFHAAESSHDNSQSHINRFVAAGDDFSLFMFIGSPPLVRRDIPLTGAGPTGGPSV